MSKKIFALIFMFVAVTSFTFAASTSDDVAPIIGKLVDFFNSSWVKGLACIALIAEALGLIFAGGQNPQVFKKFLPLIAGTIIFMCAGKISNMIFNDTNAKSFSQDMNMSVNKVFYLNEEDNMYS